MPDYLYGLVRADAEPPSAEGIEGCPVLACRLEEDLSVLHSAIADTTLQPRRAHLAAHDRVLAAAMAAGPVLPLRFGTIVDGGPSVLLEQLDCAAALQQMDGLAGKVEVELLWEPDEEHALRRVVHGNPRLRNPDGNAIDRGRRIVEALTGLAVADLTALSAQLRELTVTTAPVEARGRSARVATLVEADRLEAFLDACQAVAEQVEVAGTLRTVGGLPPYSFASFDRQPVSS